MDYRVEKRNARMFFVVNCKMDMDEKQCAAINRINAFASCRIRTDMIFGGKSLFFDITEMTTVENYFVRREDCENLLYAIADTTALMDRLSIDSRRILLRPDMIYYDRKQREYKFIFYPGDLDDGFSLVEFYEYLADHADPYDQLLYFTTLRLISLAAEPKFKLTREFLDHSLGNPRRKADKEEADVSPLNISMMRDMTEAIKDITEIYNRARRQSYLYSHYAADCREADGVTFNPKGKEMLKRVSLAFDATANMAMGQIDALCNEYGVTIGATCNPYDGQLTIETVSQKD